MHHAAAQAQMCTTSFNNVNAVGENLFRINDESIGALGSGFSAHEWRYSVLNAADQWNSAANGGWFTYDGQTEKTTIRGEGCQENWNLVRVRTHLNETEQLGHRCNDPDFRTGGYIKSFCSGSRWMITVCASTLDLDVANVHNWQWSHFPTDPDDRNLSSTLLHEMGHALELGHTEGGNYAVMNSSGVPDHGTLRSR
ncbi:MAG: hypothetical protein ACNA8W_03050 [Bradymonadaceae bacterium]